MFKTMSKLLVLGFYFCSSAVFTSKTEKENWYDQFVAKYRFYREQAGCEAMLCNMTVDLKELNVKPTSPPEISGSTCDRTSNCCSKCSCEDSCELEGTCCPDKLLSFPKPGNYALGGIYGCHLTSVKEKPVFHQSYKRMISRCDLNYKNDYVINMCEKPTWKSMDEYIIVSNKKTKEAYKNRYCARCNFVDEDNLVLWTTSLECHNKTVLLYQSPDTLLPELKQSTMCNVMFHQPENYETPNCEPLISTCNGKDQLGKYDPVVEKACSAFTAPFIGDGRKYTNILCYVCHVGDEKISDACCTSTLPKPDLLPSLISFNVILDFKFLAPDPTKTEKSELACPESAIYDHYKGECREVNCPELTELGNKTCHWKFQVAVGLCFEAYIQVFFKGTAETNQHRPNETFLEQEEPSEPIKHQPVLNYFHSLLTPLKDYDFEMYHDVFFNVTDTHDIVSIVNETYLIVHVRFSRNLTFISSLLNIEGEKIQTDEESKLDVAFMREQTPFNAGHFEREVPSEAGPIEGAAPPDAGSSEQNPTRRVVHSGTQKLSDPCTKTYVVSKFLHCAVIRLGLSDFENNNSTSIILSHSNATVSSNDFMRINNTHISMCVDDYQRFLPIDIISTKKPTSNQYIVGLVSLTCTVCSMLCLLITILVYMSFPSLRTQPGINNLSLSVSLSFAFAFVLSGLSPSLQDSGVLCVIIGLAGHFFWLNSTFWMNICCFHMFRSFGNLQNSVPKHLTQKYMAYTLIMSFVFIITNIIYSEIISNGLDIGYGKSDDFCYIVHEEMILYTMTTPTDLVLVSNLVMFIIVICRIWRTPNVSSSTMKNRKNFSIYVKLSTFTGIAWFTYIPVMFTNNFVVQIIFNTLVSLQGVFIMLAFVCNRRVMLLLEKRIHEMRIKQDKLVIMSRKTTKSSIQHSSNDDQTFHEEDAFETHM